LKCEVAKEGAANKKMAYLFCSFQLTYGGNKDKIIPVSGP